MDKSDISLKNFTLVAFLLAAFQLTGLIILILMYRHLSARIYNYVELAMIALLSLSTLFLLSFLAAVNILCRGRIISPVLYRLAKIGLKNYLPFLLDLSELLRFDKNIIRIFLIKFNNVLVQSADMKYDPAKILLLLPHCIQNSDCDIKISNGIDRCRKCMKCNIGRIKEIAEENGLESVAVVTGGTAARNIALRVKPELIIAVACERDLASGIADVGRIPVIGILNERPNGPCYNTTVDMDKFMHTLENVINPKAKH